VITIVDYGIGNIRALLNIYKRLNIAVGTASTPAELDKAERLILPGVGAFDWAMSRLSQSGLRDPLDEAARVRKVPVLGICVGMQMLAQSSEEGSLNGLGWIAGRVQRFAGTSDGRSVQLPHMGWNDVEKKCRHPLFAGLGDHQGTGLRYYFLHSYYFAAVDPGNVIAECDYHGRFACAAAAGNIVGVQFHPEKSHRFGIELLRNFAKL
jgi:glutamine amidotransferase